MRVEILREKVKVQVRGLDRAAHLKGKVEVLEKEGEVL